MTFLSLLDQPPVLLHNVQGIKILLQEHVQRLHRDLLERYGHANKTVVSKTGLGFATWIEAFFTALTASLASCNPEEKSWLHVSAPRRKLGSG